ncbi:hypothetical protein GALL_507580 [mine drainage metagenome]|uniref:Uncharacterized protein n=1 Tax=mine drainage metagenome TaxID=410659 RepID=A0A1J5PIT7_9ZZZZ
MQVGLWASFWAGPHKSDDVMPQAAQVRVAGHIQRKGV